MISGNRLSRQEQTGARGLAITLDIKYGAYLLQVGQAPTYVSLNLDSDKNVRNGIRIVGVTIEAPRDKVKIYRDKLLEDSCPSEILQVLRRREVVTPNLLTLIDKHVSEYIAKKRTQQLAERTQRGYSR